MIKNFFKPEFNSISVSEFGQKFRFVDEQNVVDRHVGVVSVRRQAEGNILKPGTKVIKLFTDVIHKCS